MSKSFTQKVSASLMVLLLAACGGGGGGGDNGSSDPAQQADTPNKPDTPATQNGADYKFSGQAATVPGTDGQVAVVLVPSSMTASNIIGSTIIASGAPVASQVQQAAYGGAFTTIASSSSGFTLAKGSTITDIKGDGSVAIGRWTSGSDSSGNTYAANQGTHYAVGNTLRLTKGEGTLTCLNVMATSPTAVTGSVAPGKLTTASATLDLSTLTLTNFTAAMTIGADSNASISKASLFIGGQMTGGGMNLVTQAMGNDAAHPLVAVGYAAKLPNTGDVDGLVVLSCS